MIILIVAIDNFLMYTTLNDIKGISLDRNKTEIKALPAISRIQKASAIDYHAGKYIMNYYITKINENVTIFCRKVYCKQLDGIGILNSYV